MKRVLVFLLLGPASAAFTVFLMCVADTGTKYWDIALLSAVAMFIVTLPVSAFCGAVDGCLARTLLISARAPLTALAGATIAGGLVWALFRPLFPTFAIAGALCMGACSLLSHDYVRRQRPAVRGEGLPSSTG
jgi:hypothetical protein